MLTAGLLGLGLMGAAQAGDGGYGGYGHNGYGNGHGYGHGYEQHGYRLQKVVTYTYKRVARTTYVTKYDDYGCAIQVPVVVYDTIKVPVVSWVKVWY